ncbi:hypothetical protein ma761 [Moumouvirus australiensis]|uniref:Uncharacterized protein n=1 Tax=Moumouvirus australiensis TaxID=2109587 RepID=A0A2P1EMQ0_9VIRU|nr:hypothetical protein QKC55_gp143 [Moumouvirus australiensis]AVL95148.1 hypothetical protein ma761 [Moumouvirus australiensis]
MNIKELSTFNNTTEEINTLVPDIFRDKISKIFFTSQFDNSFGIEIYSEISSFCRVEFNSKKITIAFNIDYVTYKSSDWNEEEPYITLNIYGKNVKNYHIKYSCENKKIGDKYVTMTKVKKINRIFNLLNIEPSIENKKMANILINNLVWKTKVICNPYNNMYVENLINANFINELNSKEELDSPNEFIKYGKSHKPIKHYFELN